MVHDATPQDGGAPVITLFTESRFGADANGRVATHDGAMSGLNWQRGLSGLGSLRLAGRVQTVPSRVDGFLEGAIVNLPYYVGPRQLVPRLWSLISAIDRAVVSSQVVCVKLPGIIGTVATASAVVRKRTIAAEVVGDVDEVLRAGVVGRSGTFFAPVASAITRWAVRRASAVRYVTKKSLQAKYPSSETASVVVHTDVAIDTAAPTNPRQIDTGLIVTVGSQEQMYKGQDVLIRALPSVIERCPRAHLEIIGDGRYQDTLKGIVNELGLDNRVSFAGYISNRSDLIARLDSAEVFALPSLTEGLPRALIEAMSRGLPCVASSVGGVPELLDSVAMCAPGNPSAMADLLITALSDDTFQEEQGRRNQAVASAYTRDRMSASSVAWRDAVSRLVEIPTIGKRGRSR